MIIMKKTKILTRLVVLLLVALMATGFAACEEEKTDSNKEAVKKTETKEATRLSYNYKLDDYVELPKNMSIEIDPKGEEYQTVYSEFKQSDVINNNLYVRITEGKLKKGDVANINYVGKLNGVAFQGGSANDYDLELGSNAFIPGFEDGLIGAEIGKTVDLNLTFPKDYGNTELAGKAVVFTVKVNHVTVYDKTTKGTLKNGDTVYIDFTGRIGGKTFQGGSAKGYKLVLGSGQLIEGFESGLIGKKIGDTVKLNLTLPSTSAAEFAGKDVVFTVKINYTIAQREQTPEEYFKTLGYKTVEEYYKSLKARTIKSVVATKFMEECNITKYPEKELKAAIEKGKKEFEKNLQAYYGNTVTLEYYLTATDTTAEELEEQVEENFAKPLMKEEIVFYALFDKAGLKIDKDELKSKTKEVVDSYKDNKVTEKTLKKENGDDYFETLYIQEKAIDYLIKTAKISQHSL